MTKKARTVVLGDAKRHMVTLVDDPSNGPQIRTRQFQFLSEVMTDGIVRGLLNCGPMPFDTLRMRHDGGSWIIEMEALED